MMIGLITQNWQRWRFGKGLQRNKSPIGQQFLTSCHLLNLITCLRGGNYVSRRYGLSPPNIDSYMRAFD